MSLLNGQMTDIGESSLRTMSQQIEKWVLKEIGHRVVAEQQYRDAGRRDLSTFLKNSQEQVWS